MKKNNIFAIVIAIIAIAVVCLSGSLFEDADKSKNYVCQMPVTGEYVVWTDGGLQWQGMGNVRDYSKTSQIEFSDLQRNESGYVAVGENPAAGTTFNDRGKGYIIGSFRVVLPNDEKNMMAIQRDFGSEKALINNLVRPTLYKVVTACGPLMSSLESVSETRTDLTAYITDQLNNGVYKTKTTKVEVLNEITGEKETRTQAELIADENAPGGYKRQENSPFSQYGITAGIVAQGQAEAEANRLKVAAGLTPQEKAEWDYKTAVGIAEALANSKVRWVPEVMMGSGSSNGSAMDAVGLNMMMDIVSKMNAK